MSNRYGYVQSRVQARYAELPDETLWLHIGALKELASFLEEARNTTLAHWVSGLSASSSIDDIEHHLQHCLIGSIDEVTSWFDRRWHPSLLWLKTLLDLPNLDHMVRNDIDHESLPEVEHLQQLLQQKKESRDLLQSWITTWCSRWPNDASSATGGMHSLLTILENHRNQFAGLPVVDAWQARSDLEFQLRMFFRRHTLQPSAAFAYLALLALNLERLRSELILRESFTGQVAA